MVPVSRRPVEMPSVARSQASIALSRRAKGISTPIAMTAPGIA